VANAACRLSVGEKLGVCGLFPPSPPQLTRDETALPGLLKHKADK
jgi:hypothetical protein